MHVTASWEPRRRVILTPLSVAARLDACFRSLLGPLIDSMSHPVNHLPKVVRLCASIRDIIGNIANRQDSPQSDIEAIRREVQVLYTHLKLIHRIQSAEARLSHLESAHLRDVDLLLHRCHRTLTSFHQCLTSVIDQEEPWDFRVITHDAPRFHMSFYTRTLEMTLKAINLSVSQHLVLSQLPDV